MDWEKHHAKQTIVWAREDIQFYNHCDTEWRKLLMAHINRKHEGKFTPECSICQQWKEIIEGNKACIVDAKKTIQEVLRGER